jgi:hypothetical protein
MHNNSQGKPSTSKGLVFQLLTDLSTVSTGGVRRIIGLSVSLFPHRAIWKIEKNVS